MNLPNIYVFHDQISLSSQKHHLEIHVPRENQFSLDKENFTFYNKDQPGESYESYLWTKGFPYHFFGANQRKVDTKFFFINPE